MCLCVTWYFSLDRSAESPTHIPGAPLPEWLMNKPKVRLNISYFIECFHICTSDWWPRRFTSMRFKSKAFMKHLCWPDDGRCNKSARSFWTDSFYGPHFRSIVTIMKHDMEVWTWSLTREGDEKIMRCERRRPLWLMFGKVEMCKMTKRKQNLQLFFHIFLF